MDSPTALPQIAATWLFLCLTRVLNLLSGADARGLISNLTVRDSLFFVFLSTADILCLWFVVPSGNKLVASG